MVRGDKAPRGLALRRSADTLEVSSSGRSAGVCRDKDCPSELPPLEGEKWCLVRQQVEFFRWMRAGAKTPLKITKKGRILT